MGSQTFLHFCEIIKKQETLFCKTLNRFSYLILCVTVKSYFSSLLIQATSLEQISLQAQRYCTEKQEITKEKLVVMFIGSAQSVCKCWSFNELEMHGLLFFLQICPVQLPLSGHGG